MVIDEVINSLMYQRPFNVGSYSSDFQPSLKPVPASCRVATKTFHVYQTLMSTFRPVTYFQHEISTGLSFYDICSQTIRPQSLLSRSCRLQEFAQPLFFAVFFCVSHDGLSGTFFAVTYVSDNDDFLDLQVDLCLVENCETNKMGLGFATRSLLEIL